jgi:hypothetical protein
MRNINARGYYMGIEGTGCAMGVGSGTLTKYKCLSNLNNLETRTDLSRGSCGNQKALGFSLKFN